MTKLEKARGKLIRLLEIGDTHLLAKVLLKDLVNEMIKDFPMKLDKEYYEWFNKYLRKGQVYTYGSCRDCEYSGTLVCDECVKCMT